MQTEMTQIPLDQIQPSRTNPRGKGDPDAMRELTESIARHGVLQPVLVRPRSNEAPGKPYELVCGHRRYQAAVAIELAAIPVSIRNLTDVEALELQVIENLQRADLHPLEEAKGYHLLSRQPGYDVAKIAERVGRSVKYVYDRMKLLSLTPEAQEMFLAGRFTAGHAILLARLKPADQKAALAIGNRMSPGAIFEPERTLFDPEVNHGDQGSMKARSVRELQAWIDEHVRFEPKAADPMLFPETVEEVAHAKKVVPITYSNYIQPEAREGRTFGPRSWKRADGKKKSKTCEHSVTGFVAVGIHRGEAFEVCVNKDKCEIHWREQVRARKRRADKAAPKPGVVASPQAEARARAKEEADTQLHQALDAARENAGEQIQKQILDAAAKATPIQFCRALATSGRISRTDWVRSASLAELQRALIEDEITYGDIKEIAGAFGINAAALLKAAEAKARAEIAAKLKAKAPKVQTSAKPTTKRPATKKPAARKPRKRAR